MILMIPVCFPFVWTVYIPKCSDGKFYTGCTAETIDENQVCHLTAFIFKVDPRQGLSYQLHQGQLRYAIQTFKK